MKRAMQGRLALLPAIQRVMDEMMAGHSLAKNEAANLRRSIFSCQCEEADAFCAGAASEKFGTDLADQQEIMGALADMIMEVLVLESAILRAEKMQGRSPLAVKMTKVLCGSVVSRTGDGSGADSRRCRRGRYAAHANDDFSPIREARTGKHICSRPGNRHGNH